MKTLKYMYSAISIAIIGDLFVSVNAENRHINKSQQEVQSGELIKKLPTALLENLHRDLRTQEERVNKNIDSIAGISKSKLEAEITERHNEDRSRMLGTRKIEPKLLPGDLLKYIAEQGISYNGCSPQEAVNEIRDRMEVADDLPSALGAQVQSEHIRAQQEKAGEEFARREDAEDFQATMSKVQDTAGQGKDPSLVKQAEYIKQQEGTKSDATNDVLKNVAEGEGFEQPPHGYDEKVQNERSSEEIKEANAAVEERKVIKNSPEKKGFFSEIWTGIKQRFNNWFDNDSGISNSNASNDDTQKLSIETINGVNEMQ